MSSLIRLTDRRPDAAIKAAIDAVLAHAAQLWQPLQFEPGYPKNGFGIAGLTPRDVAVTNQAAAALQGSVTSSITWGLISITTASTKQTWIDLKVDDRVYPIVTGIFYLEATPLITALKWSANGEELGWTPIEELQAQDMAHGYIANPITVQPGNQLKVEFVGTAVKNAVEKIGLLGYRVAKRAYFVTDLG